MQKIFLYDTTLRDGTQGEEVSFSAEDKIKIAKRLDAFGVAYIEGGWPGSNPKDMEFFERPAQPYLHMQRLRHSVLHAVQKILSRRMRIFARCWMHKHPS